MRRMDGTRALFASIGVSVSLVAAAALSLLAVSVVIAFGGWSAGIGESTVPPALIVGEGSAAPTADGAAQMASRPVVLHAPARPRPIAAAARRAVPGPAAGGGPRPDAEGKHVGTNPPPRSPGTTLPTAAPKPATGDGVRRLGDELSSTVQSTGDALSTATAPLGPPVSEAVPKVLDLVDAALQRTTNGLGGTLDRVGR